MKSNLVLCIDLKTKLQNDVLMKPGKDYPGILRREIPNDEFGLDDRRYYFIETVPQTAGKRNPRIFDGRFITVTRRDDGSLRPNFKELNVGKRFSVKKYAIGVANELRQALEGLVKD